MDLKIYPLVVKLLNTHHLKWCAARLPGWNPGEGTTWHASPIGRGASLKRKRFGVQISGVLLTNFFRGNFVNLYIYDSKHGNVLATLKLPENVDTYLLENHNVTNRYKELVLANTFSVEYDDGEKYIDFQ